MSKVKIITDSNTGILQKEGNDLGIFVIPMPFTVNGEEYLEEISISQDQFYVYLSKGAEVTTSQPSQYYLQELWTELLKDNDELVYIPMSSGLSKTCENSQKLAEDFNGKVFVVDNLRISVTQKESVFEAIALAKQGKSASEIKAYLESSKDKMSIYIVPAVLKYLKKGGRISPAAAVLGDILKVKPILYSNGLKFEKYGIALAMNQAKTKMIMKIKQDLETTFKQEYEAVKMTISVAHTQNEQEALKFKEEIIAKIPNVKFRFVDPLSLSVSCHIGAGALAVATCINNYLD